MRLSLDRSRRTASAAATTWLVTAGRRPEDGSTTETRREPDVQARHAAEAAHAEARIGLDDGAHRPGHARGTGEEGPPRGPQVAVPPPRGGDRTADRQHRAGVRGARP